MRAAKSDPPRGNSALGRLLGKSPQVITNWKDRGVPLTEAILIGRALGIRDEWIIRGEKPILVNDARATSSGLGVREVDHAGNKYLKHVQEFVLHNTQPARHILPVLTSERIMRGQTAATYAEDVDNLYSGPAGLGAFVWIADNDHMGTGNTPVRTGYRAVIDPTLAAKPGRLVLVRVKNGPPVLRRLEHDGIKQILVADNPRIDLIPMSPDVVILGTMRTAYPPPEED